jgi:four helix bundle protein
MFLVLNHQNLDIYHYSRALITECYTLTKKLPPDERFVLSSQIRRAALSVHLNIAEGASRRSQAERKRFYEIARGSLIEVDTALDLVKDLNLIINYDMEPLGQLITICFALLSGLLKAIEK